jgi:DeoR/GlpR family transcriptional regulator of sugar metabolism
LTTKKWATLTKSSHDTALRDIQALIEFGVLKKDAGGGRSTSYSLKKHEHRKLARTVPAPAAAVFS